MVIPESKREKRAILAGYWLARMFFDPFGGFADLTKWHGRRRCALQPRKLRGAWPALGLPAINPLPRPSMHKRGQVKRYAIPRWAVCVTL